jgi:hypothetical protein
VSACATLLVTALVATPLWDFWHYRGLRTGPGPGFAIGLILPPPSPQRPAFAAGLAPPPLPSASMPGATPVAGFAAGGRGTAGDARRASTGLTDGEGTAEPSSGGAPAGDSGVAGAPASRPKRSQEPARADVLVGAATHGAAGSHGPSTASHAAPHAEPASPSKEQPATATGSDAPGANGGWLVSMPPPAPTAAPQLPPDPQPAVPTPKPLEPVPSKSDPREVPQALPVLSLLTPSDSVAIGQDVTVSIRLSGADEVTSLPFHLRFDPAILAFVSAGNGSGIASLQPVLLASVNPARPGDLAVGLSFIDAGGAFNGSGTLLELRFRALAAGVSGLTLDRASIRGRFSQTLQAQFENGTVSVR